MEREELLKMIQLYKTKLADIEEQAIMYQVIISKQAEEKDVMQQMINNLETQVKELMGPQTVPVEALNEEC